MSGSESTESRGSLLLDGFRRMATNSPALLLPRLVMTQDLHQRMAGSRRRLADSHKYQMRLLGENVGDDDDGGISLRGDTTITNNFQGSGTIAKLALGALLLSGLGVGGVAAWQYLANRPPAAASSPAPTVTKAPEGQLDARANWKLGVIVSDKP